LSRANLDAFNLKVNAVATSLESAATIANSVKKKTYTKVGDKNVESTPDFTEP